MRAIATDFLAVNVNLPKVAGTPTEIQPRSYELTNWLLIGDFPVLLANHSSECAISVTDSTVVLLENLDIRRGLFDRPTLRDLLITNITTMQYWIGQEQDTDTRETLRRSLL